MRSDRLLVVALVALTEGDGRADSVAGSLAVLPGYALSSDDRFGTSPTIALRAGGTWSRIGAELSFESTWVQPRTSTPFGVPVFVGPVTSFNRFRVLAHVVFADHLGRNVLAAVSAGAGCDLQRVEYGFSASDPEPQPLVAWFDNFAFEGSAALWIAATSHVDVGAMIVVPVVPRDVPHPDLEVMLGLRLMTKRAR